MGWAAVPFLLAGLLGNPDAPGGDRAKLQGTWRVVAARSNGEEIHDSGGERDDDRLLRALDFRFKFDGDRLTETGNFQGFGEPGGSDAAVTFTIDPQTNPKALDIRRTWRDTVSVQRAIYEFRGEQLRICFGANERPKSFDAGRGSDDLLYEFVRVKERDRDDGRGDDHPG